MQEKKRIRHTASYQLSYFLNSQESFSYTWLTGNFVAILRYMYDVMEINHTRMSIVICDKSIKQISIYARTSKATVTRALKILVRHKLLSVALKRPLAPTHYGIGEAISSMLTMSTDRIEETKTVLTMSTDLCSPRAQQTSNCAHGEVHIRKSFKKYKKERAHIARSPLSSSWQPDQKRIDQAILTASTAGKNPEQLITKFKNLQLSKQGMSADWNAEFENFLINERPAFSLGSPRAQPNEIKSTVPDWGPGHPGWEALHAGKAKEVPKVVEIKSQDEVVISAREAIERYKQRKLQGELTNEHRADSSGDNSRRAGSA